jgi:hypothetical protein
MKLLDRVRGLNIHSVLLKKSDLNMVGAIFPK